jgi:hypothetical protein
MSQNSSAATLIISALSACINICSMSVTLGHFLSLISRPG